MARVHLPSHLKGQLLWDFVRHLAEFILGVYRDKSSTLSDWEGFVAKSYNELVRDVNPVRERNVGPLFLGVRTREDNVFKLLCAWIGPGHQRHLAMWNDGRLILGVCHWDLEGKVGDDHW